jgi:hypothetical protein
VELNYCKPQIYVSENEQGGKLVENPNYIPGCQRTRLIQRLELPSKLSGGGLSFGGGFKHGGLSDDAWDLLKDICTFDYMGAAEFEMGALPQALYAISKADDLEAYTLDVTGNPEFSLLSQRWQACDSSGLAKIKNDYKLSATVFVLAPKKIRLHVDQTIYRIAGGDEDFLQERTNLRRSVFCPWYWSDHEEDAWEHSITQGWIELNNGYMFFASEDMWRDFCNLFDQNPKFDIKVTEPDFTTIDKALESCIKRK